MVHFHCLLFTCVVSGVCADSGWLLTDVHEIANMPVRSNELLTSDACKIITTLNLCGFAMHRQLQEMFWMCSDWRDFDNRVSVRVVFLFHLLAVKG